MIDRARLMPVGQWANVLVLLYEFLNHWFKERIIPHFTKHKGGGGGVGFKQELWGSEGTLLEGEWSVTVEYEKTPIEVASNIFFPVDNDSLGLKIFIDYRNNSGWAETRCSEPNKRECDEERHYP
jgi:hypothetical protein